MWININKVQSMSRTQDHINVLTYDIGDQYRE